MINDDDTLQKILGNTTLVKLFNFLFPCEPTNG